MLLLPTSLPISNPLDCTFCSEEIYDDICDYTNPNTLPEDPELHAYFVKKMCHLQLPSPVLYMPLMIIIIAALLVFLDKPFVSKLFKSFNIEETYKALVKDLDNINHRNRLEKVHSQRNNIMKFLPIHCRKFV